MNVSCEIPQCEGSGLIMDREGDHDRLDMIADHLEVALRLAETQHLQTLRYLIHMACLEAAEIQAKL